MPDSSLLELLRQTPPGRLLPDELQLVRWRLAESPEFCRLVAEDEALCNRLTEEFAGAGITLDEPLKPAEKTVVRPWRVVPIVLGMVALLGLAAALAVLAGDGGLLWRIAWRRGSAPETEPPSATPAAAASPAPIAPPETVHQPDVAADPWDLTGPVRSFADTCYDPSLPQDQITDASKLRQWFRPAPGQKAELLQRKVSTRELFGIDGVWRLAAPWPKNTVWRLAFYDAKGLQLHFWSGTEGVRFQLHSLPMPTWAAYSVPRRDRHPQAPSAQLWMTDDGRFRRTQGGVVEIRWQDGQLVMTHGSVRLLTAPLAAPPEEVYVQGSVWFKALSLYPGEPAPPEPPQPRLLLSDQLLAEDSAEHRHLASGAEWRPAGQGGCELVAPASEQFSQVEFALPAPGLTELVLQLDQPQAGTGIALIAEDGTPRGQLEFYADPISGEAILAHPPGPKPVRPGTAPLDEPQPFVGSTVWLRMILGTGTLKCWFSPDGTHWGRALTPMVVPSGAPRRLRLYCLPGSLPRRIGLQQCQMRELSALTSLAKPQLLEQVAQIPAWQTFDDRTQWIERHQAVLDTVPDGVDVNDWRRACVVHALAQRPGLTASEALLAGLVAEAIRSPLPADQRRQIIDEALLWADVWHSKYAILLFGPLVNQWGHALAREGYPRPYFLAYEATAATPLWYPGSVSSPDTALLRWELLDAADGGRAEEMLSSCARFRFACEPADPYSRAVGPYLKGEMLVEWGEAVARRKTGDEAAGQAAAFKSTWRNPLQVEISRDAYDMTSSVAASLEDAAFQDAARTIAAGHVHDVEALVPDQHDRRLYLSVDQWLSGLMRAFPQLNQTMIEEFSGRGGIRVRTAIAAQDVTAVEAVTRQLFGTEEAAEAHLWLGDRALEIGDIPQAQRYFRQAMDCGPGALHDQAAARWRLAAALDGRDAGRKVTWPVTLGDSEYAGVDFERMISQVLAGKKVFLAADEAKNRLTHAVPAPARLEVHSGPKLEGNLGIIPTTPPAGYTTLDWSAMQLAATFTPELMIVSNRFQVSAFQLASGKRKWTQAVESKSTPALAWPLVSMQPVVIGDSVLVRRLTEVGPELVCLELATGDLRWHGREAGDVVSDPVYLLGKLFALVQTVDAQRLTTQVDLAELELDSGKLVAAHPLVRLRELMPHCQIVAAEERLVVQAAGSLLCCDLLGKIHWLREEMWMPADFGSYADPWPRQFPQPALVAGDLVYALQPGVRVVVCVELESGRLHWRRPLPDAKQLLGLSESRLLVEQSDGVQALDAASGEILWNHRIDPVSFCWTELFDAPDRLLYVSLETLRPKLQRPRIVWVDLATGRAEGQSSLPALDGENQQLGPLWAIEGRLWLGVGRGSGGALREFVELTAAGPPEPGDAPTGLEPWSPYTPTYVDSVRASLVPGWTILANYFDSSATPITTPLSEPALATSTYYGEAMFARQVDVPSDGRLHLAIDVGVRPADGAQLVVRAGGETPLNEPIASLAGQIDWKEFSVDLQRFAGRRIWLTATHVPPNASRHYLIWRRLELISGDPNP